MFRAFGSQNDRGLFRSARKGLAKNPRIIEFGSSTSEVHPFKNHEDPQNPKIKILKIENLIFEKIDFGTGGAAVAVCDSSTYVLEIV